MVILNDHYSRADRELNMFNTRLKNALPWLVLAVIALWPLFIINKGFDLTDTGYYLANYRYAFSHPEFNSLTTILSSWLGGIIYALAPSGQMLAIKITGVCIYAAITYWSFAILREHFPDWLVLASLALSSIYATTFFYSASYNTFSYLFLSAAIFLIYRGLQRNKSIFIAAGAVLLGLNVFIRLPNILQWAIVVAPAWYYWVCLGQRAKGIKLTLGFLLSLFAACLLFVCAYILIFGQEAFAGNMNMILGMLRGDGHTTHGSLRIIDRLTADLSAGYRLAAAFMLKLAGGSLLILLLQLLFRRNRAAVSVLGAGGIIIAILAGLIAHLTNFYKQPSPEYFYLTFYCFYGVAGSVITLAGLLYYHQKNSLLSTLCGMATVVLLAMSVGSDFGIEHYTYYTHLTITICLGLVYKFWLEIASRLQKRFAADAPHYWLKAAIGSNMVLWFMLAMGLNQLTSESFTRTMLDAPYSEISASVEGVQVLAGMRTNPVRAEALSRLKKNLAQFKDMEIVVIGQCPLCINLTDSKPFFNELWIDLYAVTGNDFIAELNQAASEGRLPIVLRNRGKGDYWRLSRKDRHKERLTGMFLKDNNYTLYYDDGYFHLYLPPQMAAQKIEKQGE